MSQLEEMKKQWKAEEEAKQKRENGTSSNTDWYPFWAMDFDETAVVRFLPDGNVDNSDLAVIKWVHKLDVEVNGQNQKRHVPCLKAHFNEDCPICNQSQRFYADDDEDNGSRFYKKKSYLTQAIILDSPFKLEKEDDGSIKTHRLINIVPDIYNKMKKQMMQGDLDAWPTDYKEGYDFRLNKTKDGPYASFGTSSFRPKSTPVDKAMLEGIELHDLATKLPGKPDIDYVKAVLHAALTGEPFVWVNGTGKDQPKSSSKSVSSTVVSEPVKVPEENKEEAVAAEASIMDVINKRRKTKAS